MPACTKTFGIPEELPEVVAWRAALPEATALIRQAYAAAHPVFAVVLYFYFQIVLLFEAASPEDRSVQRERHDAWSG